MAKMDILYVKTSMNLSPEPQKGNHLVLVLVLGVGADITEVAHRSDCHSHYEVIPFPRITSSVNAVFPVLLGELGRQNELEAWESCVFSHLLIQT
jgi:hypothetical protein